MTSSSLCSCLHMLEISLAGCSWSVRIKCHKKDGNHQLPNLWSGTSNMGLNSEDCLIVFRLKLVLRVGSVESMVSALVEVVRRSDGDLQTDLFHLLIASPVTHSTSA